MAVSTRYVVVEVLDFWAGNSAVLNELAFYDSIDTLLPYTTTSNGAYDLITTGEPNYWNAAPILWSRGNLNDVTFAYSSGNSTLFHWNSIPGNPNNKARFIVDFGSTVEVDEIRIWSGGEVEGRCAKDVNFYRATQLYTNTDPELNEFDNNVDGLMATTSWDISYFTSTIRTVTEVSLGTILLGQGNGRFWNDAADNPSIANLKFIQNGFLTTNGQYSKVDNGGFKVEKWFSNNEVVYKFIG